MADYREYPPTDRIRTGSKVGWRTYADREAADKCAAAARHNARIDEDLGFDFGFQSPGSVTKTNDGQFEVCIP